MKNQKSDFSVLKEEIAQNNVLAMAELITIMEVRFQIGYVGSRMQKMYADLYKWRRFAPPKTSTRPRPKNKLTRTMKIRTIGEFAADPLCESRLILVS